MSFSVSKVIKFSQPTLQFTPEDVHQFNQTQELPVLAGVLSDSNYCWHAKGPCLEIRNIKTGRKVGSWTFGCILKDSSTKIVCVEEIPKLHGRLSILAIGIECTISGGMICIFEVFGSKIIRAIQIKHKITSLHVVDSGLDNLNLPGPLRNFDGIIAAGTAGGDVYLIDVCRQICEEALQKIEASAVRDELWPSQIVLLTPKDIPNIDYYKGASLKDGNHLAIHLNVVLDSLTEHFTLKGPKSEDRIHVNKEEVTVSSLYYCPQLTSLLIGFNFGAYQLWNLTNLTLVYTSPICEDHIPITHFAVQEPADDPRAFCYIWVSYSPTELYQSGLPFAVMYSFSYNSKEYHEGYGYLYQDFQYCAARFQMELGALEEHKSGAKVKGGCCIGLQPVAKACTNKELCPDDSPGDTLSLCLASWTVWFSRNETQTYLLVFDLNQWYKEQMPNLPNWRDSSNYMLRVTLNDLLATSGHKGGDIFSVQMKRKTLRQFMATQKLEEHFYPSSLSFDLTCLRETDVAIVHDESLQRALLRQIESAGPLCLLRPNDFYQQVIHLGLSPLFTDIPLNSDSLSTEEKREILLDVGLEQKLIGWLCGCAHEWANGSFSSAGCSLEFLVNWAFERAIVLKKNCDNFCTPLFDYSESRLDSNTSILLNNCTRQLNNLNSFYSFVLGKLSGFLSNAEVVDAQCRCLQTVSLYFEVLQWLVNVGLLPECHPSAYPRPDETERISAPYPVQQLTEYYFEKRATLQQLSRDTFASSDSLLFIDNLISNKCGAEFLQKQWQDDGGSGLYPPPSLQSLLRTYLVEGTDISHKHSLIIYVFLDLAMALDQNRYALVITHLIKFPAVFKVSSSIIKITQAFWQLDHGDYNTAMEQLLDPFVLSDDLEPWHHAVALRALLLQNQHKHAMLYMQVRKPPISDDKDILTAISLFIANNMLDEAFYFQKQYQNGSNEKLLTHLFNECNKNDSLQILLYRSLNTAEERAFFKYLQTLHDPSADDLQVFYYLLRSRFVEAFDAHDNSKRKKPECQGLVGQRSATRSDQVVKIFKSLLPDVNQNLVSVIRKERMNLWKEVARPTPLSVFVHNSNEHIRYKSTIINAALAKAKQTFNTSIFEKELNTEDIPFLRTPKAFTSSSRLATPVITSRIIEINEAGEEGPTPSKKLKLTPRMSISASFSLNRSGSIHKQMNTPIVKRRSPTKAMRLQNSSNSNFGIGIPQSILKVRNLLDQVDHANDSQLFEMVVSDVEEEDLEQSPRKSYLGLTARKSLSRTPTRLNVHFVDGRVSSSLNDSTSPKIQLEDSLPKSPVILSKDNSLVQRTMSSHESSSDSVFYSPDASINDSSKSQEKSAASPLHQVEIEKESGFEEKEEIKPEMSEVSSPVVAQSPKSRKSYKRSLEESPPVRSSPRLSKSTTSSLDKSASTNTSADTSPKTRLTDKVRGRKSLSRKVLESNAYARILSDESITNTKETVYSKTITTTQKITTEYIAENDSTIKDLSIPLIKVDHLGESLNKTESSFHDENLDLPLNLDYSSSVIEINDTKCEDLTNNEKNGEESNTDEEDEIKLTPNASQVKETVFTPKKSYKISLGSLCDCNFEYSPYKGPELPQFIKDYLDNKESKDTEELSSDEEEVEVTEDNKDSKDPEESISNEEQVEATEEVSAMDVDDNEVVQVYEDLSSGSEDIRENLSKNENLQEELYKVYEDISNSSGRVFETEQKQSSNNDDGSDGGIPIETQNELSNCGSHESRRLTLGEAVTPSVLDRCFLADQTKAVSDVIEIGSSSEEEQNSHQRTADDIRIAFERNIDEEITFSDNASSSVPESFGTDPGLIGFEIESNHEEIESGSDSVPSSEDVSEEMEREGRFKEAALQEDIEEETVLDDGNVEYAEIINEGEETSENVEAAKIESDNSSSLVCETNSNESANVPIVEEFDDLIVESNFASISEVIIEEIVDINITVSDEDQNDTLPPLITEMCDYDNTMEDEDVMQKLVLLEEIIKDPEELVEEMVEEVIELVKQEPEDETVSTPSKDKLKSKVSSADNLQRRVTRSSSLLQTTIDDNPDNPETIKVSVTSSEVHQENPDVRSRSNSISSTASTPKVTIRRRSSRLSIVSTSSISPEKKIEVISTSPIAPKKSSDKITVTEKTKDDLKLETSKPPIRRTRSSSVDEIKTIPKKKLGKLTSEVIPEEMDGVFEEVVFPVTPALRRTRSASVDQIKTYNRKKSVKSTSDVIPEEVVSVFDDDVFPATPTLRKTRSVSVDQVKTYARKRHLQNSSSEVDLDESGLKNVFDLNPKTPAIRKTSESIDGVKTYTRNRSVSVTSDNLEEEKPKKGGSTSVENYSTSRRLTRRQASMLKEIEETQDENTALQETLQVEQIDPIILLDKPSFQGNPDPDEAKVYELSPTNSSVSSSQKRATRLSRSASVASDTSSIQISLPSTPKKKTKSVIDEGSPLTGIKSRLRTKSIETPTMPSPAKRSRKKSDSKAEISPEVKVSSRVTRGRTSSVSSAKSDVSDSSRRSARGKKAVSTKTDLPEILEERSSEAGESNTVPKRTKRNSRK